MATRDPKSVDDGLVELVRELSRRAGRDATELEARAALAPLLPAEEKALKRMGRGAPPATPLGPMAWADLARGVEPSVASARELGGYYQLLAERDALAKMVGPSPTSLVPAAARAPKAKAAELEGAPDEKPADEPKPKPRAKKVDPDDEPAPPPALPDTPARKRRGESQARAQHVLGLFAYHRDAPRVAQALKGSLTELEDEIDELGIRRKVNQLIRGLDSELPVAQPTAAGKAGPPLRRSKAEQASAKEAEEAAKAAAAKARAEAAAKDAEEAAKAATQSRPVSKRVEPPREPAAMPSARRTVEAPPPFRSAGTLAALSKRPAESKPAAARPAPADESKAGPAASAKAAPAAKAEAGPAAKAESAGKPAETPRLSRKDFPSEDAYLKAVLAKVGARRKQLCEALGPKNEPLPEKVMLARFRGAGLDRELGLRERDLLRGLFKRHHGMSAAVGAELKLSAADLAALVKERGLHNEVEALREAQRREARAAVWPQRRIELLLQKRGWLADLGVLREIEEEVRTRVRIAWAKLRESKLSPTKAVDLLGRELQLKGADARALSKLLKLE